MAMPDPNTLSGPDPDRGSHLPADGVGREHLHSEQEPRPVRPGRGVRLGDLDRSRKWVLGYTGRRWEVLGPIEDQRPDSP